MNIYGYLDSDVPYVLGLLVARGEIISNPSPRIFKNYYRPAQPHPSYQ